MFAIINPLLPKHCKSAGTKSAAVNMQLNENDLNLLQAGVRGPRSNVWKFKPTQGNSHLPFLIAVAPEESDEE